MMSSSLALISCNAAFREGMGGRGDGASRVSMGRLTEKEESEEGRENETHSKEAWEEKRERMVQNSM